MKLRFPESEIVALAEGYSYARDENELLSLCESVKELGYLKKPQLQLLANWKSPRSAGRIDNNDDQFVEDITGFALNTSSERARIEALTIIDGVGWPTASVILHLFHKEPYPILDFRALWSVDVEVRPSQYKFDLWLRYTTYCRVLAENNGVSMRTVDHALWEYSKKNQVDNGA